MTVLGRLWRGELPLEAAFWTWAVIGGLFVNGVTSALFLTFIAADQPLVAAILGYGPSIPYNFMVAVGVSRAADRDGVDRRCAEIMRFITILGAIVLSVT